MLGDKYLFVISQFCRLNRVLSSVSPKAKIKLGSYLEVLQNLPSSLLLLAKFIFLNSLASSHITFPIVLRVLAACILAFSFSNINSVRQPFLIPLYPSNPHLIATLPAHRRHVWGYVFVCM